LIIELPGWLELVHCDFSAPLVLFEDFLLNLPVHSGSISLWQGKGNVLHMLNSQTPQKVQKQAFFLPDQFTESLMELISSAH